jgi:di/tricarboxylate transporter
MPKKLSFSLALALAALIAALVLAVYPPSPLDRLQAIALGAVLVTVTLWATQALPNFQPSLIFFAVVLISGLAPPDLVFSGFSSAAVWLIVSGLVIGSAISVSGLGDRLAGLVAPALTKSYPRLVGGLFMLAMALGFVMPSSIGRAVALMPVAMALAARCGFEPGSRGRIGVAVALAIGCNVPSFAILPSNIPNMVMAGAAETIHGLRFGYLNYLMLHYPVLGLLKGMFAVILTLRLFPAAIKITEPASARSETTGGRLKQRYVALVLLITLGLWATDGLHGVNPAWIGLATAVFLLFPPLSVVSPQAFKAAADFGSILFVAGALAVGAVINAVGLGAIAGNAMEALLPLQPGQSFLNFVSLSTMSILTSVFATSPTAPAILTPLAGNLSAASGLPIETVVMTQVIGFSTIVFPYQVAPLVIAMQMSGEKLTHLGRVLIFLAFGTIFLLLPIDYLWWRLLGWM